MERFNSMFLILQKLPSAILRTFFVFITFLVANTFTSSAFSWAAISDIVFTAVKSTPHVTSTELDKADSPGIDYAPTGTNSVEGCGNTWLNVKDEITGVQIGDLDITGNKITIEAKVNRTLPYDPSFKGGDIVSKHSDPGDDNYLMRANGAEITTSNGFFATPDVCDIELNKTYHIALVYDGSVLKFYRNGFLLSQIPCTGNLVTNNWQTAIATTGDVSSPYPADFLGLIDEVRIWNIARTQDQLRSYMNESLPNPSAQNGLMAYYTFDDLLNKQGNASWNGKILGSATIKNNNPTCQNFIADSCEVIVIPPIIVNADFSIPDTVCVNEPFKIKNITTGATNFYWNFCVADINQTPVGTNLGNLGNELSSPVFMDLAQDDNGDYYGFSINHIPGELIRYKFGSSYLNNPTVENLGNYGGAIPNQAEGLQIVKSGGTWYIVIVGGGNVLNNSSPRVVTLNFGASLGSSSSTGSNWGNKGKLSQPIDLHVFQEGNNWYGFTVNAVNNTITRFDFSKGFDVAPTAVNLGGFGMLSYPDGIFVINDNGYWRAFVTNSTNESLTRLDFGNSLLNTPTAVDLGNPNGQLYNPRDILIIKFCGETVGFVVNANSDELIRLDFTNGLDQMPVAVNLGNMGNLNVPHSLSKLFRVGSDLFSFITNVGNNSITRLQFSGCNNSSTPNSSDSIPLPITYNTPGIYNINLMVDEGLSTQTSVCKTIVVKDCLIECDVNPEFSFTLDSCDTRQVHFKNGTPGADSVSWDFGDGAMANTADPTHTFTNYGNYIVKLVIVTAGGCKDSVIKNISLQLVNDNIIVTNDTIVCPQTNLQLKAIPALSYCWYPVAGLSNPAIINPIATVSQNTTYYLTSQSYGNNLITNGDFSGGNNNFTSSYSFSSSGLPASVYFVGKDPVSWNPGMTPCSDHTSGNGNMMLVNGSEESDAIVWSQTIAVAKNTNYAFSTWLQTITTINPAKLQFSINGIPLGSMINANNSSCIWDRFYTLWNSGDNTTAEISIINKNTSFSGNDFALDDISFAELIIKQDSIKINIAQPPVVSLGPDTTICELDSVMLNAGNPGSTYLWQDGSTKQTISANDTGVYIVQVTNENGCVAKDSFELSTHASMQLSITSDTTICTGSNITLSANANNAQTYLWIPSTTLSNAGINNPIAFPVDTTLYRVNVSDIYGCKASDSVWVNVAPLPTVAILADTVICAGESTQLSTNATNALNYVWSPSLGLSDNNSAAPVATPASSMQYIVTVNTQYGCIAEDSVNITVNSLPALAAGTMDPLICIGNSTTIAATSPTAVSYNWFPSLGLTGPANATTLATPVSSTSYYVQATDINGCSALDSVMVSVKEKPVFAVDPPTTGICTGETVVLTASGGDTYAWSPSATLSDPNSAITVAAPIVTTTYKAIITDNICAITDSVFATVSITSLSTVNVTKSNDIDCIIGTTLLQATGGVTYNWFPNKYLSDSTIANPVAAPLENTTYYAQVTNAGGCSGIDSVTVYVFKGSVENGYKLPTAFTPNNDGNNDCFGVRKWGTLGSLDLSIYNRWGTLVFHSNNPSNCWDGTYKGQLQPPGAYVYQVRAQALCGTVYRKGTVVLIR